MFFIKTIFRVISWLVPVNRKIIVLGAWHGKKFSGSPKAIFDELSNNSLNYDFFWVTKNEQLFKNLSNSGYPVVKSNTFKSMLIHMRASLAIVNCSEYSDVDGQFLNSKTTILNTWHGTPIKKIGLHADGYKSIRPNDMRFCDKFLRPVKVILGRNITSKFRIVRKQIFTAPSKYVGELVKEAKTFDDYILTGYSCLSLPIMQSKNQQKTSINTKKILYAPTYRGEYGGEIDLLDSLDICIVQSSIFCKEKNIELHIRLHPANKLPKDKENLINSTSNIHLDHTDDIYDTLHSYDTIITDFSSLYFDFLALRKVPILAPIKMEEYIRDDRSLYLSLAKLSFHNIAHCWFEALDLATQNLEFSDFEKLNNKFNEFNTTDSSKNVVNYIKSLN
ncbi:CDP-glycerol glycerophosphotransferase family protein [Vibrio alginolyticus]